MTEYDREYRRHLPGPIQVRLGRSTERGRVTKFFVQLEYWQDGDWIEVVRYDHDPAVHDVTDEGLHVDIYRDGEKVDSETVSPPLPPNRALDYAEEHLISHLEDYIKRFEQWHGIRNRDP